MLIRLPIYAYCSLFQSWPRLKRNILSVTTSTKSYVEKPAWELSTMVTALAALVDCKSPDHASTNPESPQTLTNTNGAPFYPCFTILLRIASQDARFSLHKPQPANITTANGTNTPYAHCLMVRANSPTNSHTIVHKVISPAHILHMAMAYFRCNKPH